MRRTIQLATIALSTLLAASAAGAQGTPSTVADEGILVLSRGGNVIGREAFRVSRGGNGSALYTLTATISYGSHRVAPALSTDAAGTPLLYQAEVRQGTTVTERLQATGRPGRLSAIIQRPGGESAREYVLPGRALVLDHEVYHQFVLVPLAGGRGAVAVLSPRQGAQASGRIESRGDESVTIDGKAVAATHWSLVLPDGARELWVDGSGRLLRVEANGVVATREELPR